MSEDPFDWKTLENNTTLSLQYQCQQKRLFPSEYTRKQMIAVLTEYRHNHPNSTYNSANASAHSSRHVSPRYPDESEALRKAKKNQMTIYQFIHTPNPIVLTAALVCTCLSIFILFTFLLPSK
ncbi:hypothetical protein TVAG_221600 [Trichomonas vaginalis G3]|uniref:Uncharacterized protein n=1 Tax=Trichomonas vaginalis (strain ATCC PRA-98 / G3) TaxID=412133 RepID=A2E3B6_TRIV3|nr:hypothetical protein TVAGG3_0970140 [Trichomonas vaginalis G3]EAY12807.1 hypothetical protein TVAG_221600 [Trichomonas vaginalis G3]KAI5488540.1 hypothetical protein TVAGG3_0970140 [Trichomonas vaginalis G3]|eukprot:XP_001325030.1 hypothetical protein [Trichomonas vaginalis G3]